ncbi:hypothetical protein PQ455_05295 [Sphingomonas naphthae]|uniref:Uncharacterized protein n=1 Tax=Sphingomonas naphthae TaxID=1813468 RepID=A0ABY7TNT7_9SPHN|nr:hypothetical protein [Sphingomonas naphthae]WCT74646.1 hypothetical protein PQ455_05295 [Sphingomonas naphthae]
MLFKAMAAAQFGAHRLQTHSGGSIVVKTARCIRYVYPARGAIPYSLFLPSASGVVPVCHAANRPGHGG